MLRNRHKNKHMAHVAVS